MSTKAAVITSTFIATEIGMAHVSRNASTPPELRCSTIPLAWSICHPTG
jgi:hypothetical protein